jgi:hypothetical protein
MNIIHGLSAFLLVLVMAGGIVSGSINESANNSGIDEASKIVLSNITGNTLVLENGSPAPGSPTKFLQGFSRNTTTPVPIASPITSAVQRSGRAGPGTFSSFSDVGTASGQDEIIKGRTLQSPKGLGWYKTVSLNYGIKSGTHPAIVSRSSGLLDMFYYNTTGYLYTAYNTQGNIPDWPGEYAIDDTHNNWIFSPAVSSWGSSNLMLFAVNDFHDLWYCRWNDAGWFGFSLVPGQDVYSTPAVVSRTNGNIELVYVNTTAQLIHMTYTEGGGWGSPEIIDTRAWPYGEGISLVSTSSDSFTVIGRWSTQIWTRTWTLSGGWGAWQNTGLPAYSFVGASVRKYSDALTQSTLIDVITDIDGNPTYKWSVSRDNGMTWDNEPYSGASIANAGGPMVIGSSRYNRIEFYHEQSAHIPEVAVIAQQHDKIAVTDGVSWYLDKDGDGVYSGSDSHNSFGGTGYTPVIGDWNGNGISKIGVTNGVDWYLDWNGDGSYSGADVHYTFGGAGWTPVVGDWNMDGRQEIGVTNGVDWYLDKDGNGAYSGTDTHYTFGGLGWTPVVGDWDGTGVTKIGVTNGVDWYIDRYGDGLYDSATDHYTFGGIGWMPVVGDWDGNSEDEVGVTNGVDWYLDKSGDGLYSLGLDAHYTFGGLGWTPVIGDWNGDAKSEIGISNGVDWYLDKDGNGAYSGSDAHYTFGGMSWIPVVGEWR